LKNGNGDGIRTTFRFKRYKDSNRPTLKFVVNFKENGKRVRKFFAAKTNAETFVQLKNVELQNQGRERVEFPSWLRIMAGECNELLEPFKKTIRAATDHCLAYLRASARSCTVSELAAQMHAAKTADGASRSHLHDLKCGRRVHGPLSAADESDLAPSSRQFTSATQPHRPLLSGNQSG